MHKDSSRNEPVGGRCSTLSRAGAALMIAVCGALSGGCAANVNDVLWEARDGDPEYVTEAVDRLGDLLAAKEASGQPFDKGDLEAIAYLKDVGEKSADPTLRARAISALSDLRSVDLAPYLVGRLTDDFWPVRLEAARGLALQPSTTGSATLAERLRTEPQPEVRANLIRALAASGGDVALKALLEVLIDNSSQFKLQAHDAVRRMTGKDFDLADRKSWSDYYHERFGEKDEPLTDRNLIRPHGPPVSPVEVR